MTLFRSRVLRVTPVSNLAFPGASACWLFFIFFCQIICVLSQAIYLQPFQKHLPVTEYYSATFSHRKQPTFLLRISNFLSDSTIFILLFGTPDV
ncbi:hypothetical protein E3Y94_01680 [Escherichia albertii]|nr:hypothetical protein [Escherichia albertii]EFA7083991.1 hypothetical protein [Escherichia albertii]HAH3027829.1 hypothetical protein [Escherichia albertii]HAH3042449.1 hypothetical protein [Escherichia albertii]HAH3051408.1 hypothetical protein [Escherichia albertii]